MRPSVVLSGLALNMLGATGSTIDTLWPIPASISDAATTAVPIESDVAITVKGNESERLASAIARYQTLIEGTAEASAGTATVELAVASDDETLTSSTDYSYVHHRQTTFTSAVNTDDTANPAPAATTATAASPNAPNAPNASNAATPRCRYTLSVSGEGGGATIAISCQSSYGCMHGLETLAQLAEADGTVPSRTRPSTPTAGSCSTRGGGSSRWTRSSRTWTRWPPLK